MHGQRLRLIYGCRYLISLPLMKLWFATLFVLITAAGTFVPCCQVDHCTGEVNALADTHENEYPEGLCSPFNSCASCPASVELSQAAEYMQPINQKLKHLENLQPPGCNQYANMYWQPPRSC
jgi:hypothetical protein